MSADNSHTAIEKEIIGTYKEVDRLYETKPESREQAWRQYTAAREIIHNAGNADNIHQGYHNTCGATSVESMSYMTHPSKAAELVTDVVLTGEYNAKTTSGKITVHIDTTPHGGSIKPMQDNTRNYASELFQVAAVNLAWAEKEPGVRYVQRKPQPGHLTGEYLFKNGQDLLDKDKHHVKPPDLVPSDISVMYSLINHTARLPKVIDRGLSDNPVVIDVNSYKQFNEILTSRSQQGRLPVVLAVDSANGLFSKYNSHHGGHAILILNYIPANDGHAAKVIYCNWWHTKTTDQIVSAKAMYHALLKENPKR